MEKSFTHSAKQITALILLGFFVFSFLHSELGFLDFDGDNHGAHDYCQIVKNTNAHSKILRENLPKLELNKDNCIHCFDEIEEQETQILFERSDHQLKAKQSADLYLFNKTFLI